jgi:hypothetical protein
MMESVSLSRIVLQLVDPKTFNPLIKTLVFAHVPVVLLEMKSATQLASRASLEG